MKAVIYEVESIPLEDIRYCLIQQGIDPLRCNPKYFRPEEAAPADLVIVQSVSPNIDAIIDHYRAQGTPVVIADIATGKINTSTGLFDVDAWGLRPMLGEQGVCGHDGCSCVPEPEPPKPTPTSLDISTDLAVKALFTRARHRGYTKASLPDAIRKKGIAVIAEECGIASMDELQALIDKTAKRSA